MQVEKIAHKYLSDYAAKQNVVVGNRRYKKQYVIGGSGIFDSILQFLIRTFTNQTAKEASKHVGNAALEAEKTVAVDSGKKLIDKAMQPKKKVEDIMSKYTAKGSAVAIQDLVKRLNKSRAGLKEI